MLRWIMHIVILDGYLEAPNKKEQPEQKEKVNGASSYYVPTLRSNNNA